MSAPDPIGDDPVAAVAGLFLSVPQVLLVMKIGEEFGEAAEAWIGVYGANPRKGEYGDIGEVRHELLDVAITALVAWCNCGGEGSPRDALNAHAMEVWRRHHEEVGGG